MLATVDALRAACEAHRRDGARLGFVPTMGALHDGHLALVRALAADVDVVVASVFVNPTQFGPGEDLARYPRDLEGDREKLAAAGVSAVFAPRAEEIYPPGEATRVHVARLGDALCGPFRPGHFDGVATVVTKLFAAVGPCVAAFGEKDFQQLAIVRRLVRDLLLPVRIVGVPIVRDADGLALSSRNAYLSPEERARARCLPRGLAAARAAYEAGERRAGVLEATCRREVSVGADTIDYVTLADAEALVPLAAEARVDDGARVVLAIACRVGMTRLLDNVVLGGAAREG